MELKQFILMMLLSMTSSLAFGQPGEKTYAWVNASSGSIMRSGPGIESSRQNALPYGTKVEILDRETTPVTIEGVTGHWTRIRAEHLGKYTGYGVKTTGWVFGGLLTNERIAFTGMQLPPFAGLWSLNDEGDNSLYNNQEVSEIVDFLRKNHSSIDSFTSIQAAGTGLDKDLETQLKSRAKKYGMVTIRSVKAWKVFSGDTLIIIDGYVSDANSNSGESSYVAYKSRKRENPDDVIIFPTFEYNGPLHVFMNGEYETQEGNSVLLNFGLNDEIEPNGKAFMTLMNGYPHLYFHYIEFENSEE